MTPRGSAVAGLAEDVGKALLLFAERLRAEQDPTTQPGGQGVTPCVGDAESSLGAAQLAVLAPVRTSGDTGITSREAAEATGKSNTNTPRILRTLGDKGLVVGSDTTPVMWTAVKTET